MIPNNIYVSPKFPIQNPNTKYTPYNTITGTHPQIPIVCPNIPSTGSHMHSEWEKVWSRLSAHLQPFYLALSVYFNNFRQKIPYFDVSRLKRVLFSLALTESLSGSLWLLLALSLSLSGFIWLSVTPTLAPSGSNLLT